ncbi:unnamed protein product [Caenorhabditis bovis]|uniref:EGF-like domain-containing protein n=1 Tax=Caenorhabditis bovis TaxID=2654633 RepID=A0A8S1F640_9PELO|nr:unnamed protein product [Caenorhabditis bovis]
MRTATIPERILNYFESCLPSWFRKIRSADALEGNQIIEETNEIGDPPDEIPQIPPDDPLTRDNNYNNSRSSTTSTTTTTRTTTSTTDSNEISEPVAEQIGETLADYGYEYDDEEKNEQEESTESIKYNEEAGEEITTTLTPEVKKEIEKLKNSKCKDYCHHNATCHVEVIFRDDSVSAVVPSCHCPVGWEGARCDKQYVQAFYAPVEGKYNVRFVVVMPTSASPLIQKTTASAIPAITFLIIMLAMFIGIVVYAYRRMSRRIDETTYTMSHMCPPEAFTVLKTPNGRKIPIQEAMSCPQRIPMRAAAVRHTDSVPGSNFFTILRNQGTIPSRNINDDDTPKHYKSVPRVEVSAINYSGHIDFSNICYQVDENPSQPHETMPPHISIQIDDPEIRSNSRAHGEPSTPTSSEPILPPNPP